MSLTTQLSLMMKKNHHANMSVQCRPPYTPLLFSETGVYRGIHFFLIFALKHRLWVLVRTASTHNLCFEQKYETIQKISTENFHLYCPEKALYVAWACFHNDKDKTVINFAEVIISVFFQLITIYPEKIITDCFENKTKENNY